MRQRVPLLLVSIAPVFLASCVSSAHPLSDEKTSTIDKRLYGQWLQVVDHDRPSVMTIGKKRNSKNTLELVAIRGNSDHTLKIERHKIFALRRGKLRFLSIEMQNKKKEKYYGLAKYELPDADTLRIYPFDQDVIGAAIVKGQLKGEVATLDEAIAASLKTPPPKDTDRSGPYSSAGLSDSPEAILRFVEKHSEKCFAKPVTFKRISD